MNHICFSMKGLTRDNRCFVCIKKNALHFFISFLLIIFLFSLSSLIRLQNIIAEHEIRNISCAAQDPEDLSTFAYITKDLKSSHHYCHVFTAFDVVSI